MLNLAFNVARQALPFALTPPANMSGQELALCSCLSEYSGLLSQLGLVEESSAWAYLAKVEDLPAFNVVLLGCTTTAAQDLLLDSQEVRSFVADYALLSEEQPAQEELDALRQALYNPDFQNPVQPQGQVRFALPAGKYAQPRLLVDQLHYMAQSFGGEPGQSVRIAVTGADPQALFQSIAPALQQRGFTVESRALTPFASTPFGSAWLALRQFAGAQDWLQPGLGHTSAGYASDFNYSLFSFMGLRTAQGMDKRMRKWRGQNVDDAVTDMVAFSRDGQQEFMSCIAENNVEDALRIQEEWISHRLSWPESYRAEQLAAVRAARDVYGRANFMGLTETEALSVLAQVKVSSSACLEGESGCQVSIMPLTQLARESAGSYQGVALCDLTANDYSLKDEKKALDYLLEALGAGKRPDPNAALRRSFAQALEAARCQVLLCRPLNDVDAEEVRPAALLEELVDCYRSDPQNADELDKVLGLPASLLPYASTLGEESLSQNMLGADGGKVCQGQVLHRAPAGVLDEIHRDKVFGSSSGYKDALSPSAIESFLDCPYKWFAERRLRLNEIDADFGPRTFGTFYHAVLELFHKRMVSGGLGRVEPSNLPDALEVLDQAFEAVLQAEQERIDMDVLLPLTYGEQLDVKRVHRKLADFVRWEADLLPGYVPYQSEVSFGYDNPFQFAGFKVTGRVDRVDTDGFSRAAVIDYKGSLGKAYNFRVKDAEDWQLPRKVQAVIYAQMVRRHLGLDPVAALFVSYSSPGAIAGLYDNTVLHYRADLLGINPDLCGTHQMLDELDRCEEAIARRLEQLRQGDVRPCPLDSDACKYCPVSLCERRLS